MNAPPPIPDDCGSTRRQHELYGNGGVYGAAAGAQDSPAGFGCVAIGRDDELARRPHGRRRLRGRGSKRQRGRRGARIQRRNEPNDSVDIRASRASASIARIRGVNERANVAAELSAISRTKLDEMNV